MQFTKQALARTIAAAAVLTALGVGSSARAQTTAFTFATNGITAGISGYTVGYSFTVNSAITVTRVGLWDRTADGVGLTSSHLINIWNGAGTNLLPLTTAIPSGAGGDAVVPSGNFEGGGVFRFYNLTTPLALAAGTYTIGANYSSGVGVDNPATLTSTPIPGSGGGDVWYAWFVHPERHGDCSPDDPGNVFGQLLLRTKLPVHDGCRCSGTG